MINAGTNFVSLIPTPDAYFQREAATLDLAERLQAAGCSLLAVHGRRLETVKERRGGAAVPPFAREKRGGKERKCMEMLCFQILSVACLLISLRKRGLGPSSCPESAHKAEDTHAFKRCVNPVRKRLDFLKVCLQLETMMPCCILSLSFGLSTVCLASCQ